MAVSRLIREDSGATLVFIAGVLVVLMGFAALAVDWGLGINERRLDQNTVDPAVLSGALELGIQGSDFSDSVDAIKATVNTNLGRIVSDADWIACDDPSPLEFDTLNDFGQLPGLTAPFSECISYETAGGSGDPSVRVRVYLPIQSVQTTFGRVIGFNSLETNAFAEALYRSTGSGSISFPSGLFNGSSGGTEFCVKSGTSGGGDSCGVGTTGDFGNFQPYFYVEAAPGNPNSICTSGNQTNPLAQAMAEGIDHPFGINYDPGPPDNEVVNGDSCPGTPGPLLPNSVDSGGGYSNNDITNGLVAGITWDGTYDGRLNESRITGSLLFPPWSTWQNAAGGATIYGVDIDNRPLWSYIDSSIDFDLVVPAGPVRDACNFAQDPLSIPVGDDEFPDPLNGTVDPVNPYVGSDHWLIMDYLKQCLTGYKGLVFTDDLAESPRLGSVPIYFENAPLPSNSCCYHIIGLSPIWLNGLWHSTTPQTQCGVNPGDQLIETTDGMCIHYPGIHGALFVSAPGQRKVDSASAVAIDCEHLPNDVCVAVIGSSGSGEPFFGTVELSR